jgi:N6-adenosine-specific RNA methylase IME4
MRQYGNQTTNQEMNMKIDQEFKALIPPLTPEEYSQLEANLIADGCRDPLVVWAVPPENWWSKEDVILTGDIISDEDFIISKRAANQSVEILHRTPQFVYLRTTDKDEGISFETWDFGVVAREKNSPYEVVTDAGNGSFILVDGHNRFEICSKHNIPFETKPMFFDSRAHVRIWMRENQKGRRNLTPAWLIELGLGNKSDLIEIGNNAMSEKKKGNQNAVKEKTTLSQNDNIVFPPVNTRAEIAKSAGVSTGQVGMAEQVKKKAPDLWEKAKQGEVSISTAYKKIRKSEKKAEHAENIAKQKQDIATGKVKLPEGVFEVVVIDPPWNYGREYDPDTSRVANPYPEMTQQELLQLNPPFAEDCFLFLWTTHAFIRDGFELLDSWGFNYKATLVWNKQKIGMGSCLRMQCEFCLIGFKGNAKWENTTWRDIIEEPRREHSRKPDKFYEMVDALTIGRKLDFFSREQREGWENYGNETTKF